jgi:hypothetical protein
MASRLEDALVNLFLLLADELRFGGRLSDVSSPGGVAVEAPALSSASCLPWVDFRCGDLLLLRLMVLVLVLVDVDTTPVCVACELRLPRRLVVRGLDCDDVRRLSSLLGGFSRWLVLLAALRRVVLGLGGVILLLFGLAFALLSLFLLLLLWFLDGALRSEEDCVFPL